MFVRICSLKLVAALTAISLVSVTGKTEATPQCSRHEEIVGALRDTFNETRRAMGVVNAKVVMEMFMSPQGTWTMVFTDTNGISCINAAGEEWQDIPVAVAGLDS